MLALQEGKDHESYAHYWIAEKSPETPSSARMSTLQPETDPILRLWNRFLYSQLSICPKDLPQPAHPRNHAYHL